MQSEWVTSWTLRSQLQAIYASQAGTVRRIDFTQCQPMIRIINAFYVESCCYVIISKQCIVRGELTECSIYSHQGANILLHKENKVKISYQLAWFPITQVPRLPKCTIFGFCVHVLLGLMGFKGVCSAVCSGENCASANSPQLQAFCYSYYSKHSNLNAYHKSFMQSHNFSNLTKIGQEKFMHFKQIGCDINWPIFVRFRKLLLCMKDLRQALWLEWLE